MEKDSFNVGAIDKLLKRLIAIWFCVLMFSSVAGVSTVKICAIIGQAAKLFNIDNDYPEPTLYKTEILIASWEGTTYTDAHMDPHYSGKIFMDKKRNIWIFDVERKDGGKYYLKFGLQSVKLEILLIVMEELTEEQPQECLNNHPDFTKEGNLTGEQIGQIRKLLDDNTKHIKEHLGNLTGEQIGQIRKLLDDNTKHIKEHLDGWNPLFLGQLIVTCIIGMMTLLCILANRNQIREGLINMKDWIQKKLCSQPMSENGSRTQAKSIVMEESVEPDLQLPAQHGTCPISTMTVTDETNSKVQRPFKNIEKLPPRNNDTVFTVEPDLQLPAQHGTCPISTMTVTDETNSKVQRPFKNIERLLPRNNDTVFTDTQSSTSNVEQNTNIKSKKRPEDLDSDSDSNDEQDKLLKDSVDPDM